MLFWYSLFACLFTQGFHLAQKKKKKKKKIFYSSRRHFVMLHQRVPGRDTHKRTKPALQELLVFFFWHTPWANAAWMIGEATKIKLKENNYGQKRKKKKGWSADSLSLSLSQRYFFSFWLRLLAP
jgi:hypothetical protein